MLEVDGGQNIMQLFWGYLLFGITPGFVGIVVGFNHQTVQTKINGPLCGFQDSVSSSHDMAGVVDDFHAFPLVFQMDGHRPIRLVSEPLVISIAEPSVDSGEFGNTDGM